MKKRIMALCCSTQLFCYAYSQSVAINSEGAAPHPSAQLDVQSISKGMLVPRMNYDTRNLIANPATGLLIYQTDKTPGFYYYNGSIWLSVQDNLGDHSLTANLKSGNFYYSKTGTDHGIRMLDNGGLSIKARNVINNITTDAEAFRFDTLGNILAIGRVLDAGGTSLANRIPIQGAGTRFMWFAARGSLRFGRVPINSVTDWDDTNMHDFTFAGGNNVRATEYGAFAYGDQVFVNSTVGVGFGSGNTVNGTAGFTAGASNWVNGFCGTAFGYTVRANGQGSVALGYRVSALNDYCVALGYRATNNGFTGTMVMGDESTTDSVRNTADNQFVARYAGGYRFYTKATTAGSANTGVFMATNANAWSSISDSTTKERYTPADPEYFLEQLSALRLGSWNYKGNRENRHYGPMAQEIFAAFGTDQWGQIGVPTALATADMDGIMMIMLQGLEKRSKLQRDENLALKQQISGMQQELAAAKDENSRLRADIEKIALMQQQLLQLHQEASLQKLGRRY